MSYLGLCLISILGIVSSSTAVSITRCKAADSACLKQSAQAFVPILAVGIPEYEVKSLDPLHIPNINASSKSDLKMLVSGVVVKGMKDCTIPDISRDAAKHRINVDVLCDVDVQGEYIIKGKILLLPIDGSGHLLVKLYQILISVKAQLKDVERDGKKYWSVASWEYNWALKDRATIDLADLFGGNPELTKSFRDLTSKSSTEIVKEIGGPIVTAITSEVVDAIKHLYSHVPANELALD